MITAQIEKVVDGIGLLESFWPETEGPFAFGNSPSLADCAVAPTLFLMDRMLPMFGVADPIGPHPKLSAYWQAMNEQSLPARVIAEMQRGLDAFQNWD